MLKKLCAKAIWHSCDKNSNRYIDFKKEFSVSNPDDAKLYICVDTQYAVYINGTFIDCGQYSAIGNERFYDTLDISNYVLKGTNELYITAYFQGEDSFNCVSANPMLLFAITDGEAVTVSDSTVLCRINECYSYEDNDYTTPQLLYNFHYNRAAETADFENAGELEADYDFKARPVEKCIVSQDIKSTLIAQGYVRYDGGKTVAQKMQNAYMKPALPSAVLEDRTFNPIPAKDLIIKNTDKGIYLIFDIEKETAGYFSLDITAKRGTELYISYSEHLDDMRVRACIDDRNFAFYYRCDDGRQEFSHYLKRIAGRYIQINITNPDSIIIHSVGIKSCEYPAKVKPYDFNDLLLNKIYSVSIDTLKLCFHEHYEDTPWREQALYMMDSRLQMLFDYYAFKGHTTQKDTLDIFYKNATENAILPLTAPRQKVTHTIPAFTLMWIEALYDYWLYTGDKEFIAERFDLADRLYDYFKDSFDGVGIRPQGDLRIWHFYDWMPGLSNCSNEVTEDEIMQRYDAPIMLYCLLTLQHYNKLAEILGIPAKSDTDDEAKLKERINSLFFDNGIYRTYSNSDHYCELVQALAILTDAVPAEYKESLRDKLANGECGIKATLSMMFFKYEALLTDLKYKDYVLNDIIEKWSGMLYNGATSFWETEKGGYDFEHAGSLCHGWSATPIYFFNKYLK